jgi:FkbM family methyltransferase
MTSPTAGRLAETIDRIWAQVRANSADMGDMFERITQSFYTKIVRSGDTVIDGGAHTGRHTIPLADVVGPEGQVIAFEPLTAAAETLRLLLARFGFDRRVRLGVEALSSERGSRDFFVVHNMPEFSGLRSRTYVDFIPDQTKVQVDVETIDSVVSSIRTPSSLSFIKLDIEGGEFRALQGAEQTLNRHRPCCVFENGLESSADDYTADEFFGYFRRIDYELYDILGSPVDETRWSQSGPWYFAGMPRAHSRELLPLLWASVLEELLICPWPPVGQLAPPPASWPTPGGPRASGTGGHVDRVEASIRISGWAGDLETGQPARSVVILVDGIPVATAHPDKARNDVVAATGQVGLAHAGFEAALRTTAGHRIEVYGECGDGRFFKLVGGAGG